MSHAQQAYGILASGRPYLTNAVPESELHQLTIRHQVGLTVPPGNPAEIANAVRQASRNRESLVTMGAMRGNWPNLSTLLNLL